MIDLTGQDTIRRRDGTHVHIQDTVTVTAQDGRRIHFHWGAGMLTAYPPCSGTRYCRGLPEYPTRRVVMFPPSQLLCRNTVPARPNPDLFPYVSSEPWGRMRCPNPRKRRHSLCRRCAADQDRALGRNHALLRRWNEEDGACSHGPGCWPSLEELIARDGGRCRYCGTPVTRGQGPDGACRDHVVPVSRGGLHCRENAALACRRCNGSKHDRMPAEFGVGDAEV